MRLHRQLAMVELATVVPFLIVCLLTPFPRTEIATAPMLLAFWIGIAYVQLFEYSYHRVLAHRGVGPLGFLKRSHLQHHRTFHGDNFCSRREEDLEDLAPRWYLFPSTFLFHYLILRFFLPPGPLVAFLGGVTFCTTRYSRSLTGSPTSRTICSTGVSATSRSSAGYASSRFATIAGITRLRM